MAYTNYIDTFDFRPHSGTAGSRSHLSASFLTADSISHGINLTKSPTLQYLFYLAQIGIAVSPLGEDSLAIEYDRNPFGTFFRRGLKVSLSSDNPLQLHMTEEPLMEEYSIASKAWKLSICDMSEIARNSIFMSGFEHHKKVDWLGENYWIPEENSIHSSNLSLTPL